MYTCNLRIYPISCDSDLIAALKEVKPMPSFKHDWAPAFSIEDVTKKITNTKQYTLCILRIQNGKSTKSLKRFLEVADNNNKVFVVAIGDEEDLDANEVLLAANNILQLCISTLSRSLQIIQFRTVLQRIKSVVDIWELNQEKEVLCNSVPNLVWAKKKSGEHTFVNDALCSMAGKEKSDVVGKKHQYIWDVDEDTCSDSETQVMKTKQTMQFNETVVRDGKSFDLITYKSPLLDCDGSVMGTIGMAIDLTREKMLETESVRKVIALRKILDTIDCGILTYTKDNVIVDINKRALKIFGFASKEEFSNSEFNMVSMAVHPEDRVRLIDNIHTLKNVGDIVDTDYRVLRKDGTQSTVIGTTTLVEVEGYGVCYQRLIFDYTAKETQHKNQVYRQQQMLYALAIDYVVLLTFDRHTGRSEVVMDKRGIFHESSEDFLNVYADQMLVEEDVQNFKSFISMCLKTAEAGSKQFLDYREKGEPAHNYRVRFAIASDECLVGIYNIDDEVSKSLEQRQLLEDMLARAESASNVKSDFLANMSHDLRTPLNAVSSFTTLALQNSSNKAKVENYLRKVEVASKSLLDMINNILTVSNLDSKNVILKETETTLKQIFSDALKNIQRDATYKQIAINIDTHTVTNNTVVCDGSKLTQALTHVLDNAVKYNKSSGEINITISETEMTADRSTYTITVSDTGNGMTQMQLDSATELFSRGRNTTQGGVFGTGIGLTIVKTLIESMGGKLSIDSQENVGTTVEISVSLQVVASDRSSVSTEDLGDKVLVVTEDFHLYDTIATALDTINITSILVSSIDTAMLMLDRLSRVGNSCRNCFIDSSIDMNLIDSVMKIFDGRIISINSYLQQGTGQFLTQPVFASDIIECLCNPVTDAEEVPLSVLVVEDNEINQELMLELLQENGVNVTIAENGKVAVDMFNAETVPNFDLILMDLQMPVMNGYDAARGIRELGITVPIVAVSANSFTADRDKAYECGMTGFIAKPVDINQILELLEQVTDTKG